MMGGSSSFQILDAVTEKACLARLRLLLRKEKVVRLGD